jgi:hypothetical protein
VAELTNINLCDSKDVQLIDFSDWISYLYIDNEDKDIQDITVYLYINKCDEGNGIKKQYFLLRPDADFEMEDETIKLRNSTTVNENDTQLNYLLYEINIATFNTNMNAKNLKWTDNVYDYLKYNKNVYFVIEDGVNVIPDYISVSEKKSDQGSGQGSGQGSERDRLFGLVSTPMPSDNEDSDNEDSDNEDSDNEDSDSSNEDSDSSNSLGLDRLLTRRDLGDSDSSNEDSDSSNSLGLDRLLTRRDLGDSVNYTTDNNSENEEESFFGRESTPVQTHESTISNNHSDSNDDNNNDKFVDPTIWIWGGDNSKTKKRISKTMTKTKK